MNNFCQECGLPRDENAKFCPNCGFKFRQEAKEEIEPTKEVEAPKETKNTIETSQSENPTPQKNQAPKIGGWLYLFAFGLIVGGLASIIFSLIFVFDKNIITETLIYNPLEIFTMKTYILTEFLFLFSTLLFFTKNKNTKIFILISCTIAFLQAIAFNMGKGAIGCVIWFLYFAFSKRVKDTFIIHHSWKNLIIKTLIASVLPLFLLVALSINYPTEQEFSQAKKREYTNLEPYRLALDNQKTLLKGLARHKNAVIQDEIKILSTIYSFNNDFSSEIEMIRYIDRTPKYRDLTKGLLYFCGKKCSPLKQNFRKSYDYLNNLNGKEREGITLMLAEMDLYGIGTRQNIGSAVKNANLASNLNEYGKSMKYYYLGLGYLYGEYYTKNIDKAVDCFRKSANYGNASSAFLTALLMATENKEKYDYQTIVKYFKRAISLDNFDANLPLALYYYNNNKQELAKQTLLQCSKTISECKTAYQKLFE